MINSKWLELYRYLTSKVESLPPEQTMQEQLTDKLMFLSAQFLMQDKMSNKEQIDWLEHEAFTLVLSQEFQNISLSLTQLNFVFETLMAAQLCQLSMATINHHKTVFPKAQFKTKCGLVYQQLGEYEHAKSMFEDALIITPSEPMLHCHLGFNYIYTDNVQRAIECFKNCIEVAPDFVGGYQNLSGLHYQQGEFALASDYAEMAFKQDNQLPSNYITAISSYLALGNTSRAEQWINAAFDNTVTSMELVRLAGILAYQQERFEEAIEALSCYLNRHPSSFDVLGMRTRAKARLKRHGELESDLKQLLVFEPHDEWLLEQLFLCYFQTQQWADAQTIMVALNRLATHYKITYREQLNEIRKNLSVDIVELD